LVSLLVFTRVVLGLVVFGFISIFVGSACWPLAKWYSWDWIEADVQPPQTLTANPILDT
jgi:hypothetical protein